MIASMLAKRKVRSVFDTMSQDDFDVNAVVASMTDDSAYDIPSDLGVGETVKGKKAIAEWLQRWKKEYPKRKFDVKSICYSAWPLCPTNVCTVNWTFTQTNREGKQFKYDGVSVFQIRNFKVTRGSDYISFVGLPRLSTLIKPSGKA